MNHWTPENVIALVIALPALLAALAAFVLALKGQGDHKANAADIANNKENLKSVERQAESAIAQAGLALLHTPSPSQGGTTVNTGPQGIANVTEAPTDAAGSTP
jgi:hypothetical protein